MLAVPTADDKHEHLRNTRFQKAKEKPVDIQSLIVVAGHRRHQTDAPEEDHTCGNALDWETLSCDDRWISASDEPEVKYRSRKRVPVANVKVEVCTKTEQRLPRKFLAAGERSLKRMAYGLRNHCLVVILQCICATHEWK
jgi:hypothetical protein